MIRFLLRRIGLAVPTLLGVSIVIFVTIRIVPGDPVASLLGPTGSAEARERLTKDLGLDTPNPRAVRQVARQRGAGRSRSLDRQADRRPSLRVGGVPQHADAVHLRRPRRHTWRYCPRCAGGDSAGPCRLRLGRAAVSLFSISAPQYSVGLILHRLPLRRSGVVPLRRHAPNPTGDSGFGDLLNHLWLPGISAALRPARDHRPHGPILHACRRLVGGFRGVAAGPRHPRVEGSLACVPQRPAVGADHRRAAGRLPAGWGDLRGDRLPAGPGSASSCSSPVSDTTLR